MRRTLGLCLFFLVGCSSDKFTNGDASTDGATGCGHELCDDFDQPNEQPGNNPPWTSTTGNLAFGPGNASKQSLEAKAAPLGSYVRWSVRTGAKGVTCSGDVWLEPVASEGGADTRDRTIAVVEVDAMVDAGSGTFFFGVGVNDVKGVTGGALGPATLNGWGASTQTVPTQKWLPFKYDVIQQNGMLQLSATVGPAVISGSAMFPYPINALRIDLGAANGLMTIVRWDNVTCDSH